MQRAASLYSIHTECISLESGMLFIGSVQSGSLSTAALVWMETSPQWSEHNNVTAFCFPTEWHIPLQAGAETIAKTPTHSWKKRILCSLTQEDDSDWHFDPGRWKKRGHYFTQFVSKSRVSATLACVASSSFKRVTDGEFDGRVAVLTAGRASDGVTNPSGRTHRDGGGRDGWRWGRTEEEGEVWRSEAERWEREAVGEREPRERWGMTTRARGTSFT